MTTLAPQGLRSFVAVPLPGALQAELAAAAAELARELPGVKWSKKPENFHVTMKFLGPVAAEVLEALGAALSEALAEVLPFELQLHGFGAFPSPEDAKVLFAKVWDETYKLAELADIVETASARMGIPREARPFTGHVTLGRSPTPTAYAYEGRRRRPRRARVADRLTGGLGGRRGGSRLREPTGRRGLDLRFAAPRALERAGQLITTRRKHDGRQDD
ncbi:MAG TPA: RNA 2',3'-cyclic phosphodiesterase [Polyangia bacterium]|jgi:2'-5' RNA ligase|nr:RNA 2',3'-cyclic phosphodiesterase [Polyangia bacterium]